MKREAAELEAIHALDGFLDDTFIFEFYIPGSSDLFKKYCAGTFLKCKVHYPLVLCFNVTGSGSSGEDNKLKK